MPLSGLARFLERFRQVSRADTELLDIWEDSATSEEWCSDSTAGTTLTRRALFSGLRFDSWLLRHRPHTPAGPQGGEGGGVHPCRRSVGIR